MFNNLKRKYSKLLLLPVTVIIILYSVVVFWVYSNLLISDYNNKITYYGEQQVSHTKDSLRLIEVNMKMFFSELDMTDNSGYMHYKLSTILKKFKNINMDISTIYFSSSDSQFVFLLNENLQIENTDPLLENYPQLFHNPVEEIQWYYIKNEDPSLDSLLCLQSATVENENVYYTIGIVIPISIIQPPITTISDNIRIFSPFIVETSIIPDNNSLLFMGTTEDLHTTSLDSDHKHSWGYFSSKIGEHPFTLYIEFARDSLNKLLFFFFLGMLIICSIFFLSAYIVQKIFTRKLIQAFHSLKDQFANFLDNEDSMFT